MTNPADGVPVLEDLPDPSGKRVLVRTDFNVPLTGGVIDDDMRIRAAVPTLRWLDERGAKVTACSHLGRPKGKADPEFSMDSVRARLAELMPGVELAENLRFDAGEEANDPAFVDRLIDGYDLYVNDAFGASHRAHASIVGPPAWLPSAAGRLLAREVEVLGGLLAKPRKPFVAVLGGSKVSDKLGVIQALLGKVDKLVVGGGMCFTFLAAQGNQVGDSLLEPDQIEVCKQLLAEAGSRITLPSDITALGPNDEVRQAGTSLPAGWKGLDIGPGSAAEFTDVIGEAGTVFWNGPMGVFEDDRFAAGTRTVAHAVADCRGFTVVGGGDSASALAKFGLDKEVDHVSTGGGASLELLEQGDLPGLQALPRVEAMTTAARKPLISGNWKMNHNHLEAIQVVQKLAYRLKPEDADAVDVSVHPPLIALRSIQTLIDADRIPISLGAQNCYWEEKGAFPGEVSAQMLAKLQVSYVIVGHSERRQLMGETDEMVQKKATAVLAAGMTPIVCCGETLDEREAGGAQEKVQGQVRAALETFDASIIAGLVIAYEPIWAIGTGRTAQPSDAQEMCAAVRAVVADIGGDEAAQAVRVQYGGSVNPTNAAQLMAEPDIDGALVGGASLDPDDFSRIVQYREGASA